MNALSEKLCAIRLAKGYSFDYMAKQLSVTEAVYRQLELAPEQLNVSQLLRLSQVLGVAPAVLLPDTDPGEPLYARMTRLESKLEEMMVKMVLVQTENPARYS